MAAWREQRMSVGVDLAALRRRAKRSVASLARPVFAARARRHGEADPADWDLARDESGRLTLGAVDLTQLAHDHGTPLHVVDRERLADRLDALSATVECEMAASHRCTHVTGIVDAVRAAGWRLTTSSEYELDAALAAGVGAPNVVHAPAVMSDAELAAALAERVGIVCLPDVRALSSAASQRRQGSEPHSRLGVTADVDVLDDIDDMGNVASIAAQVRLLDPDDRSECRHLHVRSTKRTIGPDGLDHIADAATAAWSALAGVLPLETLSISIDLRPSTVRPIAGLDAQFNQALGRPLGGRGHRVESLSTSMVRLHARLKSSGVDATSIVVDPGTAATGGTQFTLASVISIDAGTEVTHVVLDCGVNVAERTLTELHELIPTRLRPVGERATRPQPHRLVGPICTPADVLYANWWMIPPVTGDVLAIMDTGGPSVAESTTFSFPRPAVLSVGRDGDVRVLRDAESVDDLVALDLFEPTPEHDNRGHAPD